MNKLLHNEHNVLLPQVKTFSKLLLKQTQEYLHQKQFKQKQFKAISRSTVYTLCVVRLATKKTMKTRKQAKNKSNRIQVTRETK